MKPGTKVKMTINRAWYSCPLLAVNGEPTDRQAVLHNLDAAHYDGEIVEDKDDGFVTVRLRSEDGDTCTVEVLTEIVRIEEVEDALD